MIFFTVCFVWGGKGYNVISIHTQREFKLIKSSSRKKPKTSFH